MIIWVQSEFLEFCSKWWRGLSLKNFGLRHNPLFLDFAVIQPVPEMRDSSTDVIEVGQALDSQILDGENIHSVTCFHHSEYLEVLFPLQLIYLFMQ